MDAHQRGAVVLRISVTEACGLRCVYCAPARRPPPDGAGPPLTADEVARFVRAMARGPGVSTVRLTGGEPLERPDLADLVRRLAREGVAEVALTTNGQNLAERAASLAEAGLARVNVSLDALDPALFRRLTGGGEVERTLAGVAEARRRGLWPVKLNMVVLRGLNLDEVPAVAAWAVARGHPVRFLELMPIGPARAHFAEWFVPTAEVRAHLAQAFTLTPLPEASAGGGGAGSRSSRDFLARDRRGRVGRVGFISPVSQPFCRGCRRLRLTSTGHLVGCLARGEGTDVRPLLRDGSAAAQRRLVEAAREALRQKRTGPAFETPRPMVAVGG